MRPLPFLLVLLSAGPDSDAAVNDLKRLPPEQQKYTVYLTTATVAPEHRENLINALKFVVPSLSSRSYLGDQIPVEVQGTNLLRCDLQGLGWESTWAKVITEQYIKDYRPDLLECKKCGKPHAPLVVSGLWVVAALTDPELSGNGQYLLLYGKELKTANEFKQFWQVNTKQSLAFGRLEGKSGVSVEQERVMRNLASGNRGYYWETLDSRIVAGKKDPLEDISNPVPEHDASELIAAIPKHYAGESGSLQAYFLADGKGNRQEKAPADIVVDHSGLRGVEIRNTVSCISCHEQGILHPTLDKYRQYVLSGARIYAKEKATQQEIDRYYDSPIAKEITRNIEDYTAGIKLCNDLTPKQNVDNFRELVRLYDADVTVEQAARELYCTPEEWRLALGNYSRQYGLTGRLAFMSQGQAISREQWQENFALAQKILSVWHSQSHQ